MNKAAQESLAKMKLRIKPAAATAAPAAAAVHVEATGQIKKRMRQKGPVTPARSDSAPDATASSTSASLTHHDDTRIKFWNAFSGEDPKLESDSGLCLYYSVQRQRPMRILKLHDKTMMTLSCTRYGEDRSAKLMEFVRCLVLRGFSKQQLDKFKFDLEYHV